LSERVNVKDANHSNMKVLLLLILLCVVENGFGQTTRIDSLQLALARTPEPECAMLYLEIAWEFESVENDTALCFARKARRLAMAKKDTMLIVQSGYLEARLLGDTKSDSSLFINRQLLPLVRSSKMYRYEYLILNKIGLNYIFQQKIDKALESLFECLHLDYVEHDRRSQFIVKNNIGLAYYKIDNFRKAEEYYGESLEVARLSMDTPAIAKLWSNISLCKSYQNRFGEAGNYIDSINALCASKDNPEILLDALFAKGMCEMRSGRYRFASTSFSRALANARVTGHLRYEIAILIKLAEVDINLEALNDAEQKLKTALTLCSSSLLHNEKLELYTCFILLYEAQGDLRAITRYQKKYIRISDSIHNYNMFNNLVEIEKQFAEKKNLVRIYNQGREIEYQGQLLAKQRLVNFLIAAIALLLGGLVYLLYRSNRYKNNVNKLLDQKVKMRTCDFERGQVEMKQRLTELEMTRSKAINELQQSVNRHKAVAYMICSSSTLSEAKEFAERIKR
jgi:tetratricopeptide (TPR) repeat protein